MTGEEFRYSINMAGKLKSCQFLPVLVLIFFFLTSFNLRAQEKSDIGIFAGTSYYMGDLNSAVHYAAPAIAVGPIFRYSFNARNSVRAHAIYHGLSARDQFYSGYNSQPGGTEFNTKFVDLGLDFEFNWEPYKTAHRKTKASPYVFAGIGYGLRIPPVFRNIGHLTMPFGIGYKINVGQWLSGGVEASARKTFTDNIDGITNPPVPDVVAPFGNRDWYFFTGVFVTYKIFKFWEDCPTYD